MHYTYNKIEIIFEHWVISKKMQRQHDFQHNPRNIQSSWLPGTDEYTYASSILNNRYRYQYQYE